MFVYSLQTVCKHLFVCVCLCLFAKNPAPAGVCKQCLFANCLFVERIYLWQTDAILLLGRIPMKVIYRIVFFIFWALGGYEGTLLSRGDLDMFCFVVVACFQGATPN